MALNRVVTHLDDVLMFNLAEHGVAIGKTFDQMIVHCIEMGFEWVKENDHPQKVEVPADTTGDPFPSTLPPLLADAPGPIAGSVSEHSSNSEY